MTLVDWPDIYCEELFPHKNSRGTDDCIDITVEQTNYDGLDQ